MVKTQDCGSCNLGSIPSRHPTKNARMAKLVARASLRN